MVPSQAIKEGDWGKITELTKKLVAKLSENTGKETSVQEILDHKDIAEAMRCPSLADKRVITFGELMLRLAPEGYYRFLQADKFQATFGGGEPCICSVAAILFASVRSVA